MKEKMSGVWNRLTTKENRKLAWDVFIILFISKFFFEASAAKAPQTS